MAAEAQSGDAEQRYRQFQQLRDDVWENIQKELGHLRETQTPPTEFERKMMSMGVPLPLIEPQVRDAVVAFNEKGYPTFQSGFNARHNDIQFIAGSFTIDEETRLKLATEGAEITQDDFGEFGRLTVVQYRADKPDLNQMKVKWDTIATMLPNKSSNTSSSPPPPHGA